MNLELTEEYKKYIGIFLFVISIIILLYLLINPAMSLFFNIDEQFTYTILNLPFNDAWKLIVNDVHPPLYYLIVMGLGRLLGLLNITMDTLYLMKLSSILPLVILMLLSVTKIRKDYGWLSSGVFIFAITTMTNMSEVFITGRMYSWAVLFLTLTFLCYIQVLKSSRTTSWILLTIFTVLSAYTHYILVFPLLVMYLTYLVYIALNDRLDQKKEKRKLLASVAVSIICYIPWILTLARQLSAINRTYIHTSKLTGDIILNYLTCFVLPDSQKILDMIFWKFLVVVLAVLLIILFIREIKNFKNHEAFAVFSGANIYIFTILLASFFVTFIFKGITVRYFVAIVAVLWLSIAILLSRIKDNRVLLVVLILIFALGAHGFYSTVNDLNYHNQLGLEQKDTINKINNADNIIIYNGTYNSYHLLLSNCKEYSLREYSASDPSYTYAEDLTTIMDENPDKNVYLVTVLHNAGNKDVEYPDGITGKKLSRQGKVYILKLTQTMTDENKEANSTKTTENETI